MTIVFGLIAIAALFFLVIDIIDVNRFVNKEYVIESDKIKKEYCIVMLSDLHNRRFGKDNYKLVAAIDEIDPDIICCAGDMMVAHPGAKDDTAVSFMKSISAYPVYYGIGNHEFRWKIYKDTYGYRYDDYVNTLSGFGVKVLENDGVVLEQDNIRIQGLMIDREYYKRFKRTAMSCNYIEQKTGYECDEHFNILLAHNPEYFDAYMNSGYDLVFAGHYHGGIMRLPVIGGVISPRLTLFPKYSGGIYNKNDRQMIVGCGLGCHTLPLRIFNPGEVVIVRLKPCSK